MSASSVPLPPSPFPSINTQRIKKGIILHRTHSSTFGAGQFNPCLGQATRFSPFADAKGNCVSTLYAATTLEAAAFETIFHDIDPTASIKTARLDTILSRSVSRLAPKRDLIVAALFAPDLHVWGLARSQLIETPKSTYGRTVLWAKSIHAARSDLDGLVWTSRRCDPERCAMLFGDRVRETDFDVLDCVDVRNDAAMLLNLRSFGKRAGITIVS